eukprot:scaffold16728_cov137-Isochrysis_galbana.AAC.7
MGWWLERLMCYDFMPNECGVIVADVATWTCVYEDEFVPECNVLGTPGGCRSTWYDGRSNALAQLAIAVYGADAPPFKLRMRAKNRTFKECPECQLPSEYAYIRYQQSGSGAIITIPPMRDGFPPPDRGELPTIGKRSRTGPE